MTNPTDIEKVARAQGGAGDAIDFACDHCGPDEAQAFLEDWRGEQADQWPGYIRWLKVQRGGAAQAAIAALASKDEALREAREERDELLKQRLVVLAAVYAVAPRFVAKICDESLDRSGKLLGDVRTIARAALSPTEER